MYEINDAPPCSLLLVIPQSCAARRDPRLTADAYHLAEDQAGAADRARSVMHQMEIGRHALLRRIHAHRRHHGAIGDLHLTQPEGLEQRHHWLLGVDFDTAVTNTLGKRSFDL